MVDPVFSGNASPVPGTTKAFKEFDLAMHNWDEPLNEMTKHNQNIGLPLVTPKIGELVNLNDSTQVFTEWWKEVEKIRGGNF